LERMDQALKAYLYEFEYIINKRISLFGRFQITIHNGGLTCFFRLAIREKCSISEVRMIINLPPTRNSTQHSP